MRALVLLAALALAPAIASADIVKYETPDGGVGFAERDRVPEGATVVGERRASPETSNESEPEGPVFCPVDDISAIEQLLAAEWSGDACMEDWALSAAFDLRDACRSSVAAGTETEDAMLLRIIRKYRRKCDR